MYKCETNQLVWFNDHAAFYSLDITHEAARGQGVSKSILGVDTPRSTCFGVVCIVQLLVDPVSYRFGGAASSVPDSQSESPPVV